MIDYIQHAAEYGLYEIRGLGAKRKVPTFDDLVFLTASLSRYPLEGYRERCETKTVLGTRFAKKPIELKIPDHDRRDELSAHSRPTSRNRSDEPRRRSALRRRPATAG